MIKLIAIDMDGTLLDSGKKLPKENIEAIREAASEGVKIVICTGRSQRGVEPYFEQLGFDEKEYVILNNGCSVQETLNWSLLHKNDFSKEQMLDLIGYVNNNADIDIVLATNKDYYFVGENPSKVTKKDAEMVFTKLNSISEKELNLIKIPVFKAMYMGEQKAVDAFQSQCESKLNESYSGVRSQSFLYEVLPQNCNKASGLAYLAKYLQISPSEIMAIGDANNDLEMLQFAGVSIAMDNASDFIKQQVNWVTKSNDEAGVAHAIRKFILK